MVTVLALWAPILLAAVLVFVASSVIHMVLGYHNNDYGKLPQEERVMEALRETGADPDQYAVPYAGSMKELNDPEFVARMERGPVAMITLRPPGGPAIGKSLAQWFVFSLVVGVFAAYLTGRALGPGAEYLEVFRFAGTTAFAGYVLAQWPQSIWWGQKWSTTLKNSFDGLIYALLTAGAFGWLWPGG